MADVLATALCPDPVNKESGRLYCVGPTGPERPDIVTYLVIRRGVTVDHAILLGVCVCMYVCVRVLTCACVVSRFVINGLL